MFPISNQYCQSQNKFQGEKNIQKNNANMKISILFGKYYDFYFKKQITYYYMLKHSTKRDLQTSFI